MFFCWLAHWRTYPILQTCVLLLTNNQIWFVSHRFCVLLIWSLQSVYVWVCVCVLAKCSTRVLADCRDPIVSLAAFHFYILHMEYLHLHNLLASEAYNCILACIYTPQLPPPIGYAPGFPVLSFFWFHILNPTLFPLPPYGMIIKFLPSSEKNFYLKFKPCLYFSLPLFAVCKLETMHSDAYF